MSILEKLFGKKETREISSTVQSFSSGITELVPDVDLVEGLTKKEKTQLSDRIESLTSFLIYGVVFLTPLLFSPFTSDPFDFPKQTFLLIFSLFGLLLLSIKSLLTGKIPFVRSSLNLPIILIVIISIVSAIFSDNRVPALTSDTILFASTACLYLLLTSHLTKQDSLLKVLNVLFFSATLLALVSIFETILPQANSLLHLPLNSFYLNLGFSPAGSPLSAGLFLATLIPIGFALLKETADKNKTLTFITFSAIVLGLLANIYILYQNRPVLLDHSSAWRIATGALGDSLTHAFLGFGPGHFLDAFTTFKPLSFDSQPYWNLRFSTSSNFYFYILTTLGITGLAALALLLLRFIALTRSRIQLAKTSPLEKGLLTSICLILILLVFFPGPTVAIFLLFCLLGLLVAHYHIEGVTLYAADFPNNAELSWTRPAQLIVSLGLLAFSAYYLGTFLLADFYFNQSLIAASQARGADTYNFQIKALSLNPWQDNYRISYSQTNLALANALAGASNLSDQQKQTVVQLVQQSIREARNAVSLQPRRAAAWENLSTIYRSLINFAQGADQWALASENQAINLDPTNPRLRLDLGGIYYSLKDFQSAAQIFNQAASLKPDYANAHYNLAQALKQLNIKDQALQQLQLTATIVCTGQNKTDCQKVQTEVQELTQQISKSQAGAKATPTATPAGQLNPESAAQPPLASPAAQKSNLPKARTTPPATISSPSGQLQPGTPTVTPQPNF